MADRADVQGYARSIHGGELAEAEMLGRGRPKRTPSIDGVRELTLAEVEAEPRGRAPSVKRFRDSHHKVARLFAMGLRPGEVAEAAGYSLVRVSTLSGDPAFQQLVSEYREAVNEEWKGEVGGYYNNINKARDIAARMLLDKLTDADDVGEDIPLRTLVTTHGDLADRTGFGKRSTQVNVDVDFAAMLDRRVKHFEQLKLVPDLGAGAESPTVAPREGEGSRESSHSIGEPSPTLIRRRI